MRIRCWGARGSMPVSGAKYLKYGGDTTCLEIETADGQLVIVDAGTGIRRLGNRLIKTDRKSYHFLFTHAHWDHVMGFPFFMPLYDKSSHFFMHRCPFHTDFIQKMLTRIMEPPNFPVRYDQIAADIKYLAACPQEFRIGDMRIAPIPLNHPNGGSGYRFEENGKVFVFLTDNELGFEHPGGMERQAYVEFAKGADLLIHDAEYTPAEYRDYVQWGHSSYVDAVGMAVEAEVQTLGLFHLNRERSDREMDDIVARCKKHLKKVSPSMQCTAIATDDEFTL
jgi:ribonuclease BN (tRNA processing enzyme)